ncbi:MAG: hypothetical protein AABW41_02070 [Nanoarchaeota archaeon]
MRWDKINFFLVIIVILIVAYFISTILIPKNCNQDRECFNKKASYCVPAVYKPESQGNIFSYRILGSTPNNSCTIEIKLEKASIASSQETKELFEGKSMTCKFPKQQLAVAPIQETSNILNYCTGPLKEATLEMMIRKLYGTIAQNLGDVLNQIYNNQTINKITNPSSYTTNNGTIS